MREKNVGSLWDNKNKLQRHEDYGFGGSARGDIMESICEFIYKNDYDSLKVILWVDSLREEFLLNIFVKMGNS